MSDESTKSPKELKIDHFNNLMGSLGMSKADVAKYLGIKIRTVYRYLAGETSIPHAVLLALTLTLPKE
jgi:transcriptional regulator with XRE-family HTH domain